MNQRLKIGSLSRGALSLKTKITVLVVFLILAILVSISYLQIERDRLLHTDFMGSRAYTIAKTILINVLTDRNPDWREIQRNLNNFLEQEFTTDIVFISLLDQDANILSGSVNKSIVGSYTNFRTVNGDRIRQVIPVETQEEVHSFIDKLLRRKILENNNNIEIYNVIITPDSELETEAATVSIGLTKTDFNKQVFNAIVINISIAFVYIIIGIIASIFLGGAISKPIKVLEEAMKRVSAGDLHQRLEIHSKDEIGTLAATFNYMTEGLREKEKIKREFLVARDMQFNLLPRKSITHDHLEIATYFEPATEVGGDYYDFIEISEDKIGIVIADVSGHGMSAGLMMAITKSCLHTQLNFNHDLSHMMASMNNILFELSEARSMVTMFFSILDMKECTITFTNAGHPFTYHIGGNKRDLSSLESISYPLAVKRHLKFNSQKVKINNGDYFVFYSDGIVEALDEEGNVFSFERLEEILSEGEYSSAQELLEMLITEVRIHIGTAEQFDDITAVVIKVK